MALSIEIPKINYLTGEIVSGRIIYHPTSDRVIYGIHIHFTGSEYCDNLPVADIPFQKRWILDGATTVYGNEAAKTKEGRFLSHRVNEASESKGVLIKAGEYNFPFTFQIPQKVPPSCVYKNGKIKIEYLVEAIVEIPWSRSVRSSKVLKVGTPYFLEPERPLQYVRAEKSFIFHNTPGNYARPHLLKVESCVDKLVTYSGDKITLTVHVDNNSGRSIGAIKVKLKQTWTTGLAGIWEKFTISKAKYKDSHFPLGQGKHRVLIPMVIPALETRPTVQNASLIRCVYHVTLKISFRMSGDLRVRLPIILSTFPPKIRSPNSNPSVTIAELPSTNSQPSPTKVITFNWDDTSPEQRSAVLPEIQPITPLQPLPSETSEMGPSLNISDFIDVSNATVQIPSAPEILYSERIKEISSNRLLTLESSTPVENPHLSIEKASSILQESTRNLLQALSKLVEAANSNDFSTYVALGKQIEEELDSLLESASFTSNSSRSPSDQQAIQNFVREIADNVMKTLTEIELKMENARSGTISNSNSNRLMDSVQNVHSVLNKLLECSRKVTEGSRDFKGQMNEIKEVINKLLVQFNNPFGDSHSDAKMSDVITATSTFEKRVQTLIEGLPGPRDETLKNASHAADALCELMLDSKGVAKQYNDSFSTHLVEVVRRSTGTLMRLLDSSMVYETNGVVPQIVNSQWKDIQSNTTEINNLILTKQDSLEIQKKKLPKLPQVEDKISLQLSEAMESLTAATQKLNLVKESQPFNLQVLSETHSVASAIRQLLDASQKAQKERTSKITAGRFYHADPTWSDGLVSAAKQVVVLVQQLVNICSEKEIKMEIVVSLARAISATTAQLIIADRAKTDPRSESHDLLVKAARAVAVATDELLKAAEKNAKEEETPTISEGNGTLIGERVKELEASANIAKLEKQLEKARLQLGDLRKQQYSGKPDVK